MTKHEAIKIAAREAGWTEEDIENGTTNAALQVPGVGNQEIPFGSERLVIDAFKRAILTFARMSPLDKEQMRVHYLRSLREKSKGN